MAFVVVEQPIVQLGPSCSGSSKKTGGPNNTKGGHTTTIHGPTITTCGPTNTKLWFYINNGTF